jgi:hypothetical protein
MVRHIAYAGRRREGSGHRTSVRSKRVRRSPIEVPLTGSTTRIVVLTIEDGDALLEEQDCYGVISFGRLSGLFHDESIAVPSLNYDIISPPGIDKPGTDPVNATLAPFVSDGASETSSGRM